MPPGWESHPVGLEELVLAYLRAPGGAAAGGTPVPHSRSAHAADGGSPMSVLTLPAQPGQETDAALRPVPWRRMAWVTWRQHRGTLISVAAVLAAVAVFLRDRRG